MSTAYYYFAASLPALNFGDAPPQTTAEFLEDCQRLLADTDYVAMQVLLTGQGETANAFARFWQIFVHDMRNTIAGVRAGVTNRDPLDHLRGEVRQQPLVVDLVAQAEQAAHPLEGERILAQGIWEYAAQQTQGHYFDLVNLMVYGLQLQMLERFAQITPEAGKEKLQEYRKVAAAALEAAGRS